MIAPLGSDAPDLGLGPVVEQTAVGTYQVNPDGTGTAEFTVTTVVPPGVPDGVETFSFALTDNGKEALLVSTTANVIARGVAKRQ